MTEPKPLAPFATHRMTGTRFEEHAVPVTVLSELVAYRDLVLLVARSLFFAAMTTAARAIHLVRTARLYGANAL